LSSLEVEKPPGDRGFEPVPVPHEWKADDQSRQVAPGGWFCGGREEVRRWLFPGRKDQEKGKRRRERREEERVEAALLSSTHWSRAISAHRRKPRKGREEGTGRKSGERAVVFLYPTIDDEDYVKKVGKELND